MFGQYRVIGVTPAGRARHLRTLVPYLLDQAGLIDEHHLWVNTQNAEDLTYLQELAEQHPNYFRLVHRPEPWEPKRHNVPRIRHFWKECMDENTIYIRFDDDICWVQHDAVAQLLKFRIENPEPLLVYPAVINSGRTDHIHQIMGLVSDDLPRPWRLEIANHFNLHREAPELAAMFHSELLERIRQAEVDALRFPMYRVSNYERVPINCICYFGRDIASFKGEVGNAQTDWEEEWWVTEVKARELKRPSMICGESLMAHYAFHNQRTYLDSNTNFAMIYEYLAKHRNLNCLP